MAEADLWQEIRRISDCTWSPCVWKSVLSCTILASGSITKMNRRGLPPLDYIGRGCSAVKLGHWCEHTRQCTREKTDNTDTCCDVIKGMRATGHPRHETTKTVAAVFPGVPRVGQSHASRRSEDVVKCTVTQWCWNGLKEEGHKTPKKFWCAPPLFCGAPPVERAQQKIGWARPRDTSFISSLTMRRAI